MVCWTGRKMPTAQVRSERCTLHYAAESKGLFYAAVQRIFRLFQRLNWHMSRIAVFSSGTLAVSLTCARAKCNPRTEHQRYTSTSLLHCCRHNVLLRHSDVVASHPGMFNRTFLELDYSSVEVLYSQTTAFTELQAAHVSKKSCTCWNRHFYFLLIWHSVLVKLSQESKLLIDGNQLLALIVSTFATKLA